MRLTAHLVIILSLVILPVAAQDKEPERASHLSQTPFMHTQVPGYRFAAGETTASSPSYDWLATDIEVRIGAGKDGSQFKRVDVYDGIVKLRGDNTYKILTISVLAEDKNMANTEEQDDSQMVNAD
ncbi:hypothetical protein BKA57DRAFT_436814 [Linnemannia elongata]|nr:hypothetical protein BKA57DRAFT_436814 [Linnemannia elongata]